MRWSGLIVLALLVPGRAAFGQSSDPSGTGLQACLQAARVADDDCAKLTDNPAERIECFQKARAAELDCLDHALSDAATGTTGERTPSASAAPQPPAEPTAARSADVVSSTEALKALVPASPPEAPTGSISESEPAPPILSQQPQPATIQAPAQAAETPVTKPAEVSTAAAQANEADKAGLRESTWVVSETSSPVDYSPLMTATIRPASRLRDGPNSLAVRCRRGHTDLSIWNENGWHSTRSDALLVDYRVDKEPIVRLMWTLSADARTATYKDDAVQLLRSLPEGALLSISVPDGASARHEATFLLNGWTAIRQKIEKMCKWPPVARVTRR